jgi:hypothetical protein
VRELFSSHTSESGIIDEFASSLAGLMTSGTSVSKARDIAATIRAVNNGEPPRIDLDAWDRMSINSGLAIAAIKQLEIPAAQVVRRLVAAEHEAADQGVWLVPRDEEDQAAVPGTTTTAKSPAPSGPRDVADLDDPRSGRADFGSLLLQLPEGSDVRLMESDEEIVAIEVHLPHTVLQLQAFAAGPHGAWDAVREELAEKVVRGSGTAREIAGIGTELWTQSLETRNAEPPGIRHMRFLGKDGPGWFCRAVLLWRGTQAQEEFAVLENVFRDTVIVRGPDELADHARLPLAAP